jgi:hypothetical protein
MVTPEIIDPAVDKNTTAPASPVTPVRPMEDKKFDHMIENKLYPASSLPAGNK